MILGGVNSEILEYAKFFETTYLKTIMDQVGTTNLAPWERSAQKDAAEEAYRLIVDPNGEQNVQLVNVLSERGLATSANSTPGVQPHNEAILNRRQELLDDDIVDSALGPFSLVYNADIRPQVLPDGTMGPGLTPEALKIILTEYAQKAFGSQARWDDDLLHLWTIVHEGIFNRQRFDIKLRAMTFSEEAIEKMASPGLQEWARRRNEMVRLIKTAFPGQTEPTWSGIVEAVLGDPSLSRHLDAQFVRARNNPLFDIDERAQQLKLIESPGTYPEPMIVDSPDESMIDVTGIPVLDALPGRVGYTKLRDQLEALNRMSDQLVGVPTAGREWTRQMLMNWRRNPELVDPIAIINWDTAGVLKKRPSFQLYMGKSYGGYRVDDEGNLILDLTPRTHAEEQVQVSMSLDRSQAVKYSFSQVGQPAGANTTPLLFTINGDELLASQGLTIDDVRGEGFYNFSITPGETAAATLNPPVSPYSPSYNEGRREFVLARAAAPTYLFTHLSNPASYWLSEVAYLAKTNPRPVDAIRTSLFDPKAASLLETMTRVFNRKSSQLVSPETLLEAVSEQIMPEGIDSFIKGLIRKLDTNQSIQDDINLIFSEALSFGYNDSLLASSDYLDNFSDWFFGRSLQPDNSIVIPAGSWQAQRMDFESFGDAGLVRPIESIAGEQLPEEIQRVIDFSTTPSYSPFYESLDDAMPAMRFAAGQQMNDPRYAEALKLSPRWHTMPDSTPVFIVDTRTVSDLVPFVETADFDRLKMNPAFEALIRRGFGGASRENDLVAAITAAITQQQPLIVSSEEAANAIADAIGEYLAVSREQTFTSVSRRPAIGKAYFPTQQGDLLPGFTTYPAWTSDNKLRFRVYGWDANDRTRDNYDQFPLIWDWVDSLKQEVGPTEIMDAMMEHIVSNVKAGRRLVRSVRDTDNVPTLYRNIMGEPVELMPGEIITGDDLIYLRPDFDETSLVEFSDQRYFQDEALSYEGSNELLWPIMGPVMADHAESALGWRLYDLKNPIEIAPIGSRRKETIYTNRTHVRSASRKHVALTNAGDLPDWEIVQRYRPVVRNRWDQVVQYGFNNIVSPTIDAITRKPMAFHAFVIAAQRNKALTQWAIRGSAQERALRDVILSFSQRLPESKLTQSAAILWGEFGRLVGTVHGDSFAGQWDNLSAISYLRGLDEAEFDELFPQIAYWSANQLKDPRIPGLLLFAEANKKQLQLINIGDNTDGFLQHIDRIFGEGSALEGRPLLLDAPEAETTLAALTNDDWAAIKASAIQRQEHNTQLMDYAAEHAVRDVMPFVDSHEIRSQFSEYGRGLLPFWYAEENFLKRWAKIFTQGGPAVSLEKIRKLQLTYMGLKNVGIVRTDSQGRDYFVYPGSELLASTLEKVLPGQLVPITTLIQTPTERIIPGFQRDFGRPSVSPFVAISLDAITTLMPETKPVEEAFVGREYSFNSVVESIVPRHIANVWNAIGANLDNSLDPSNTRVASAMNAAIAHLDATGQGLPDDATPGQRDDFLRTVRSHARIIVMAQALAGFFTPGPAQTMQIPEGGSLDWITDGKISNPAELLSSSYYELISELGIEAGTQRYLELYPNARLKSILNPLAYTVAQTTSPSGAPLPTTDGATEFYLDNRRIFEQYPNAGAWLLPQRSDADDTRSQYAFDTEMVENLRERRAPSEVLTMIKYKEGANVYFNSQAVYERSYQTLQNSGQTEQARSLNRQWLAWADAFRATHPLFAQMLTSDDARQRRRRVLDEMRVLLKDPLFPKAPHFEAMRILQDSFDAYSILRGELGLDRTASGEVKLSALKIQFRAWVDDFLLNNPMVQPYWISVLQPEAGLE